MTSDSSSFHGGEHRVVTRFIVPSSIERFPTVTIGDEATDIGQREFVANDEQLNNMLLTEINPIPGVITLPVVRVKASLTAGSLLSLPFDFLSPKCRIIELHGSVRNELAVVARLFSDLFDYQLGCLALDSWVLALSNLLFCILVFGSWLSVLRYCLLPHDPDSWPCSQL